MSDPQVTPDLAIVEPAVAASPRSKVYKFKFMDGMQVGFQPGQFTGFTYDPTVDCFNFQNEAGEVGMIVPKRNITLMMIENGASKVGIGIDSNVDVTHMEGEVAKAIIPEEARQKILEAAKEEAARFLFRKDGDIPVIIDSQSPPEVWRVTVNGHEPTVREIVRLCNSADRREKLTDEQRLKEMEADIVLTIVVKDEQPIMDMSRQIFEEFMKSGTFRPVMSPICENEKTGEQYNFSFSEDGKQVMLKRCIVSSSNNRKHELLKTNVGPTNG